MILAIDPSGIIGWARWSPESNQINSGVVEIGGRGQGLAFTLYRDWLQQMIIGLRATHIVREAPFIDQSRPAAAGMLYGLAALTEEVAFRHGRIPVDDVTPHVWRKFFIGQSHPPRTVAKKHRRAWLKDAAVKRCGEIGVEVADHNAADAVGLLCYQRARLYPEYASQGDLGL